jgi:hypothetical protein
MNIFLLFPFQILILLPSMLIQIIIIRLYFLHVYRGQTLMDKHDVRADLNNGFGEGCAYRGRLLVTIKVGMEKNRILHASLMIFSIILSMNSQFQIFIQKFSVSRFRNFQFYSSYHIVFFQPGLYYIIVILFPVGYCGCERGWGGHGCRCLDQSHTTRLSGLYLY